MKYQRNRTEFPQLTPATKGQGMNFLDLERALHTKCNRIPMAVIQRLFLSMVRRCMGARGLMEVMPDTEKRCDY